MTDTTRHLAMYLDAPLQSWGYMSRYDRRTTLSYPTRSGLIGMIAAAMGIRRDQPERLHSFRSLELAVYILELERRLTDFHTVGAGYDKDAQRGFRLRTASGKSREAPAVTYREYLQASRFGAVWCGPVEQLATIGQALQDPRWGIWLGRKACIPASPVFQGIFATREEATEHLSQCASRGEGKLHNPIRQILEVAEFAEATDRIADIPIDFQRREFTTRQVQVDSFPQE